jgi:hypothetical protein
MPTENDDNSKSLLLAELGRQYMCFWTILGSVNYEKSPIDTRTSLNTFFCSTSPLKAQNRLKSLKLI